MEVEGDITRTIPPGEDEPSTPPPPLLHLAITTRIIHNTLLIRTHIQDISQMKTHVHTIHSNIQQHRIHFHQEEVAQASLSQEVGTSHHIIQEMNMETATHNPLHHSHHRHRHHYHQSTADPFQDLHPMAQCT
jgi:hypothetical protein